MPSASLQLAVDGFDFGDGGAFPDIDVEQFPLGLGRRRPPAGAFSQLASMLLGELPVTSGSGSTVATAGGGALVSTASSRGGAGPATGPTAAAGSKLMVVQTAESQLTAKNFDADVLQRPDAAVIEEERLRTKAALDATIAAQAAEQAARSGAGTAANRQRVVEHKTQTGQSRMLAVVDAVRDPLDPRRHRVQKKETGAVADTAPIVRSPTKKPANGPGTVDTFRLPQAVKSWTNPKNLLFSVEDRERADGRNYVQRDMSSGHLDLASAMRAAEQEVADEATARAAAEAQRKADLQLQEEKEIAERAVRAVQGNRGGGDDEPQQQQRRPAETREERLARRQQESEMQERVREERLKQRRMERTAANLGIDLDAATTDEQVRQQLLDTAPVDDSGKLDARLQYARGAVASAAGGGDLAPAEDIGGTPDALYASNLFGAGGKSSGATGPVDMAAVRREMDLQDRMAEAGGEGGTSAAAGRQAVVAGTIEDMDDDDQQPQPSSSSAPAAPAAAAAGAGFNIDDLL